MKPEKRGVYRYVPAAMSSINMGGAGLYVKYGTTKATNIEVRARTADYVWIVTPDRELLFVGNTNKEAPFYPSQGTFDEFVNLSPYHEPSARDWGLEFIMTNFTEYLGKKQHSPQMRKNRRSNGIQIISDSGGFQILTGKLKYINPRELVEWYNDNADIGLVLDIPTEDIDVSILRRLAQIQKNNTQIMMEHKSEHLELMNIFHGIDFKRKQMFREIVERDDIKRVAMGGAYFGNVAGSIYDIMRIMMSGQKYEHYHVLGVTNIFQLFGLMRMASYGMAPLITSDSSTYYQKAISKEYLMQDNIMSNISHLNIGKKTNKPDIHNSLPCSCPVCARVGYYDIFSLIGGKVMNSMLAFHNFYKFNSYLQTMNDYAAHPIKEMQEIFYAQLGKRAKTAIDEGLKTLQFIDTVQEIGLEKAAARFSYYLSADVSASRTGFSWIRNSLFSDQDNIKEQGRERKLALQEIVALYESGKVGKTEKGKNKITLRVRASKHKKVGKKTVRKKRKDRSGKEAPTLRGTPHDNDSARDSGSSKEASPQIR